MLTLSEFNRELWKLNPMEFVRLGPSIERMALKYFCRLEPCISVNCLSAERRNDDAMVFRKKLMDGYGKTAYVFLIVQTVAETEKNKAKCVLHYFGSRTKHWYDASAKVSYVNCQDNTKSAEDVLKEIRALTVQNFFDLQENEKSKAAFLRLLNSFVKR